MFIDTDLSFIHSGLTTPLDRDLSSLRARSAESWGMPIIPGQDPNEAYEIGSAIAVPTGRWRRLTCRAGFDRPPRVVFSSPELLREKGSR